MNRARRARWSLAAGVAFFAAAQLGLGLIIEHYRPGIRDPEYLVRARRLRERIATETAAGKAAAAERPLTVVALGSSRTLWAVKGDVLERHLQRPTSVLPARVVVHNLAAVGTGPVTELLYFRRLLDDGVRPDLLLVEVYPPLLSDKPLAEVDESRIPNHALRAGDLELLARYGRVERRAPWLAKWSSRLAPCHACRFDLALHFAPTLVNKHDPRWFIRQIYQSYDGWGSGANLPRVDDAAVLDAERRHYEELLAGFRVGRLPARALRELLQLCRDEGIPAALLLMPESRRFRDWYPEDAWPQLHGMLTGLRLEFGVPVIDARAWSPDCDFRDCQHLLAGGAEKFSRRLAFEVIGPLAEDVIAARKSRPPAAIATGGRVTRTVR
jgi:hypothetical protein